MSIFNFEEFLEEWQLSARERGIDLEELAQKASRAIGGGYWDVSEKDFERMVEEVLGNEK